MPGPPGRRSIGARTRALEDRRVHDHEAEARPAGAPAGRPGSSAPLVAGAREGDEGAWRELVWRHERLVWDAALRVRGLDRQDYEDVVATTWCRLVDALGRLRDDEAVGAWLRTTAYREALHEARSRSRRASREVELAGDGTDAPVHEDLGRRIARASERRALLTAGQGLGSAGRRLLLAYLDDPDASYRDIEARYGIALASIGPTRQRAFCRLRENLVQLGVR